MVNFLELSMMTNSWLQHTCHRLTTTDIGYNECPPGLCHLGGWQWQELMQKEELIRAGNQRETGVPQSFPGAHPKWHKEFPLVLTPLRIHTIYCHHTEDQASNIRTFSGTSKFISGRSRTLTSKRKLWPDLVGMKYKRSEKLWKWGSAENDWSKVSFLWNKTWRCHSLIKEPERRGERGRVLLSWRRLWVNIEKWWGANWTPVWRPEDWSWIRSHQNVLLNVFWFE